VSALDPASCYRALAARDARFDGLFFVGVKTTGIYCRPICPARTPGASRCEFFARAAEAEAAGFRACFRCRPELAPGLAHVDSIPRLVHAAAARIEAGWLNGRSVDDLAHALGVSGRHLRRAMEIELGVAPLALAQTRRLALAKQLLQDTDLRIAEVALAAGFASVRRFNALFVKRFGRPPSAVRGDRGGADGEQLAIRLDYRPPLAWDALRSFLAARAIPGVEAVTARAYRRTVTIDERVGWVEVSHHPTRHALRVRISLSLAPCLPEVVARLRSQLDLDARPDVVAAHLRRDPLLAPLVRAAPGLRVPGAFDGFELAVRAVLGQQVSVAAATTLSGRLARRFGHDLPRSLEGLELAFPNAATLAGASVASVREIGLPEARARTLVELSRAFARGEIDLSGAADPVDTIAALMRLPGVGPWTAHYLAMRALRWPDAFPAADLAVRHALGVKTARAAEHRAEPWRPWRSYAVVQLWHALAQGG
jgi:AraC family transcriptional regulator, regulatory protein of adaptative response / DNA-3-methyladenine glycosylase II